MKGFTGSSGVAGALAGMHTPSSTARITEHATVARANRRLETARTGTAATQASSSDHRRGTNRVGGGPRAGGPQEAPAARRGRERQRPDEVPRQQPARRHHDAEKRPAHGRERV